MFGRKIFAFILCIMMIVSVVSITASANTVPTSFSFFPGSDTISTTNWRYKDTTSSIYIKVNYMSASLFSVHAEGAYSQDGAAYNASNGYGYSITYPTTVAIRNYVLEWGYSYARVKGVRDAPSGVATGTWSPDWP